MRPREVRVSHVVTLCYYNQSSRTSDRFLVCGQFKNNIRIQSDFVVLSGTASGLDGPE